MERTGSISSVEGAQESETLFADIEDVERALGSFLDNRLEEAERVLRSRETSLYHSLGLSAIMLLKGLMTFEKTDSDAALATMQAAETLVNGYRRREGLLSSLWGGKSDMSKWTVVQRHAELVHAELIIMKALVSILSDETGVYVMIKEALNIRSAHGTYKEAKRFLDANAKLINQPGGIDPHFVTGVSFGIGMFNLLISLLPPKVVRLVEIAGFSGNQTVGLGLLVYGTTAEGIRSEFCRLATLFYDTLLSAHMDLLAVDLERSGRILSETLAVRPSSLFYRFFYARHLASLKQIDEAVSSVEASLRVECDFARLKHMFHWELGLLNLINLDFGRALDAVTVLANENNWSRAFYSYFEAVLCLHHDSSNPLILARMGAISTQTKKIAGKSIPFEKYVARKARKFAMQGRLCLPALELLLIFNGYSFMGPQKLQECRDLIGQELKYLQVTQDRPNHADDYALCLLLNAVVYSRLALPETEAMFEAFFDRSAKITLDHLYEPLGCLEAARFHATSNPVRAISLVERGLKPSGYSLESTITTRLHNLRKTLEAKTTEREDK